MERIAWHYTPKHGSWLNMAEMEFSVLARQCLNRRIETAEELRAEVAAWERDYERQLFALACEQVRRDFQETTWQAFWLTAIQGKSGKEVAGVLGLTTAAVYLAKRRVTGRLKQQIEYLRAE